VQDHPPIPTDAGTAERALGVSVLFDLFLQVRGILGEVPVLKVATGLHLRAKQLGRFDPLQLTRERNTLTTTGAYVQGLGQAFTVPAYSAADQVDTWVSIVFGLPPATTAGGLRHHLYFKHA
jgi:hypothetical protein